METQSSPPSATPPQVKPTFKHFGFSLFFGVFLPLVVVVVEISTKMCAAAFFDPLPTLGHVVLVAFVPICNGVIIVHLVTGRWSQRLKTLFFFGAMSIGVSAFYALIFLPLTPIAVIAILYFGFGFIPLAPLFSFLVAIRVYLRLRSEPIFTRASTGTQSSRPLPRKMAGFGFLAGIVCLILLDIPASSTHLGLHLAVQANPSQRDQGLMILRRFADQQLLLRLCYSRSGAAAGPLSFLIRQSFSDHTTRSMESIREIYYRVTGEPFNQRSAPRGTLNRRWLDEWQFDRDLGGAKVGGRMSGLDLQASRIDGSINGDQGIAYLEWEMTFVNHSQRQREVRLQLELPPGSVTSRATLWVNGEEREAAFAGAGQVRDAYQSVVQTQRDPLLVTTEGGGRVLAQAFPVPRQGGTIKFRLGFTQPLALASASQAILTLPKIVNRNFNMLDVNSHALWLESGREIHLSLPSALQVQRVGEQRYRITGDLLDRDLISPEFFITVARDPKLTRFYVPLPSRDGKLDHPSEMAHRDGYILQSIESVSMASDQPLWLVLDGSQQTAVYKDDIVSSLSAIPQGSNVGLIIAAEKPLTIPLSPWSPKQQNAFESALNSHAFYGGQDNTPALIQAILAFEHRANHPEPFSGEVLWLHGPQPVAFASSAARLDQALERLDQLPSITSLSFFSGPNRIVDDTKLALWIHGFTRKGHLASDVKAYFSERSGANSLRLTRRRVETMVTESSHRKAHEGSTHIQRLWANEEVYRLLQQHRQANHPTATQLGAENQLVTPVSGAVVLESAQQYQEHQLTPAAPSSVPTIPEPRQWLLMLLVALLAALYWQFSVKRHRDSVGRVD